MNNDESEVTRYIRIPEPLANRVHDRLMNELDLFRPGMALDDLIIPYLEAYVAQMPPASLQTAIDQGLARVREGKR